MIINLLLDELRALELALATDVKNHESDGLARTAAAVERLNESAKPAELANETLAALVVLNLHVFQVRHDTRFEAAARRVIETANTRWNDELRFFQVSTQRSNVFWTAANAKLGEALYAAWRVLEEQTLRPKAGEILGHVSDLFALDTGLCQYAELPDGATGDTKQLDAYAAAIQMFLTASETTGRGTYIARACIAANFALDRLDVESAPPNERTALADALVRLERLTGEGRYGARARKLA